MIAILSLVPDLILRLVIAFSAYSVERRNVYNSTDWAMYLCSVHSFRKRFKKCVRSIRVTSSDLPESFLGGSGGI
jgi:hypothetical protein